MLLFLLCYWPLAPTLLTGVLYLTTTHLFKNPETFARISQHQGHNRFISYMDGEINVFEMKPQLVFFFFFFGIVGSCNGKAVGYYVQVLEND